MVWHIGDYVIFVLAMLLVGIGLFRGFSGTLGFFAGMSSAVFAGFFVFGLCDDAKIEVWKTVLAVLGSTILTFGIVRLAVKKVVNKLLAQPTDSIVGMIIALVMVALLVLVWAYLGAFSEHSTIVSVLREFIGQ